MDQKLTLKVDNETIVRAKEYADSHNTSLSRLVEIYFHFLSKKRKSDYEISPAVKKLSGIIKLPKGFDYKKERQNYLIKKYLSKKNG